MGILSQLYVFTGTAKAKFEQMNKDAKKKYDEEYKEWLEDGGEELLKQVELLDPVRKVT